MGFPLPPPMGAVGRTGRRRRRIVVMPVIPIPVLVAVMLDRRADVAGAVSFFLSDDGSYITGQILGVNGGRNT